LSSSWRISIVRTLATSSSIYPFPLRKNGLGINLLESRILFFREYIETPQVFELNGEEKKIIY